MRPALRVTVVGLGLLSSLVVRQAPRAIASGESHAPEHLNETGLYAADRPGVVDPRNRPFSPQYPLWSDGASKSRWVYLPPGSSIEASDEGAWDFPVGTRFWKEFTFNGRKVETRMLWKAAAAKWVTASYVWNEQGTDAILAPPDGVPGVVEVASGRRHAIPSTDDCLACHGAKRTGPLGFNALQLSNDRDPNAIHGEALAPGMVTVKTLVDERRLTPDRHDLVAHPPRIHTADPLTRAVIGYFVGNCGSCHNNDGEIATLGPSLRHTDVGQGDALARKLVDHPTAWQVPGLPEGASVLVSSHAPESSAMLVRMRSRRPSTQMPPLGTVLRDDEAIAAVTRWIAKVTSQ